MGASMMVIQLKCSESEVLIRKRGPNSNPEKHEANSITTLTTEHIMFRCSSAHLNRYISFLTSTSSFASFFLTTSLAIHRSYQYNPLQLQAPVQDATFKKYEHLARHYQVNSNYSTQDAKMFHLEILKRGIVCNLFLSNTLVNLYAGVSDLLSARKLFDEMAERNAVSWSCLISGYTRNGMPDEACALFKEMMGAGLVPNDYSFGSALKACQACGRISLGMQIHGLVLKTMHAMDVVVCNVLISMYGKCLESSDLARCVFYDVGIMNLSSWNAIISVCSVKHDGVSAFELFSSMQREYGFKPNEYTFGSLITSATSTMDCGLSLLEQIVTRAKKSGFLQDLYVGSALVSGLARFGMIAYARDIFEGMSRRNVVTMNGLMVGLVRQKQGEEAAKVFMDMKHLVELNLDSYAILLSSLAEFSLLDEGKRNGKEIHGHVIRNGLHDTKAVIGNGLVNMYSKCGLICDACTVFRLMLNKDSVSWNSMISGLDQNDHFDDAVLTFCEMRKTGYMPSNFTLISTLSSCASLDTVELGKQIHCEGIKWGLDWDVSVSNALLAMYGETGWLTECERLFSLMPEYDQVSWNSVIGALADSDSSVPGALSCFMEMMQSGWVPNRVTFISSLEAVSSLSLGELSRQIHTLVLKHNAAEDRTIENALISCYGKCGEIDDCEKIFTRMTDRRDEVSWNSMISGYIHNELLHKAMDLVWFMMQRGQSLDCFTFATVLSACASVATLERGMEVHARAIRACLESDVVIGSALVDMYTKCGRVDYASRFFKLMPVKNVYSWNSMISGYARHGHGDKALEIFRQMKINGQTPDHVTFVGVLSACSHVGLVGEGFQQFDSMTKIYGLSPRIEHFACMVDLLGRKGDLDKVEDFIKKMPVSPNVLIWRTVLGACSRANGRKTELGRKAGEMLLQMEPENAVNYVLLANMYASGGKWNEVAKARSAKKKAAVKKEAGCSWVTMKDGVHVFVARDQSHPEKDLIYEKLREISQKMRDAGYVPQTNYALYDLELENKEELLSYHSEKLAIAFVLTRKSAMPIRIMKNLRVCGDCHSAFKYISKIASRLIILRDSNRFHHFEDGNCSCRDYW